MSVNLKSKAKVEKATTTSRSPTFDKLMTPHGFTKEHDEPRSHVFMVTDHFIVDRAYGGRFQLKSWKEITKPGKALGPLGRYRKGTSPDGKGRQLGLPDRARPRTPS